MQKLFLCTLLSILCIQIAACKNIGRQAVHNQDKLVWQEHVNSATNFYREYYQKAKTLLSEHHYQEALETLNQIADSYIMIGDYVLFYKAEACTNIPDEASTITYLKKLISIYPDSNLIEEANYKLGQAYVRTNDPNNARKQFNYIIQTFPKSKYAVGSLYYLGNILLKNNDTKEALSLWEQYLTQSPDGTFAQEIISSIEQKQLPQTNTLKKGVGLAHFYLGNYQKAINYLSNPIDEKTWYPLAQAYQKQGDVQKALTVYKYGLYHFPQSGFHPESMTAINLLDQKDSKTSWRQMYTNFKARGDFALWKLAELENGTIRYQLYQKILTEYPQGNYAPESLRKIFWQKYNTGNYQGAIQEGEKYMMKYSQAKSAPIISFWLGKAYAKQDNTDKSRQYYTQTYQNYPRHYYGFRAKYIVEHGNDTAWMYLDQDINLPEDLTLSIQPYFYKELGRIFGAKFAELAYLKQYDDLEKALDYIQNPIIESWVYLNNGNINKSIVTARENLGYDKYNNIPEILKLLYPLYYGDLITEYSRKHHIDPFLTLSITKEESYFNPLAISSSKAMGLMQLLPTTAADVAKWENLSSFNNFDLFTPETNINLGTRYLQYLHNKFNGNSVLAVAGYNGGPTSVSNWLKSMHQEDYDQFIENIPYEQTQTYVYKVFGSYWNYVRLYGS